MMRFECFCGAAYSELTAFLQHFERAHPDLLPERPGRGRKWKLVNELKRAGLVRVRR